MASSSAWNLCYLRAALPSGSSSYPVASVCLPAGHSPSGLKLSRHKSSPRLLNSYVGLAQLSCIHICPTVRVKAAADSREVEQGLAVLSFTQKQLTIGSHVSVFYSESWLFRQPAADCLQPPQQHQSLLIPATKSSLKSSKSDNNCLKSATSVIRAVASIDYSDPAEKEGEEFGSNKYHFVVANAKFMLDEEEHFQELMGERMRNFTERNKEQDFWLVIEPKFFDKFPNITKRLNRPAVALVSTNGPWITYMKLRLDRVLQESFEADSLEETVISNPVNIEFDKPEKWTAPYPKYESGWWVPFLPSKTVKV